MPVLRRCVVTLAAVAGLSSAADSGEAATIDLSWDVCSPFVLEKNPSAPGALGFVVSVKGKNEPHQTYEFWIEGTLADAWWFDAGGRQGPGRVQIDHFRPIPVKSCPNFTGAAASVQIKSVQPAPGFLGYADGTMVVALANSCPAGANTAIAAARYLLGHVGFVHAASVTGVGVSG